MGIGRVSNLLYLSFDILFSLCHLLCLCLHEVKKWGVGVCGWVGNVVEFSHVHRFLSSVCHLVPCQFCCDPNFNALI